ncbi:MAG: DNA-3-methyladenine glycosylase 2 family protein [Gemmatimonadaceae bacterium]|jgi:DNA-3-methyladenine glycosylase II|nr:DNA-3-methyladenine glycosylase 2 family protein [Gemmatimonadaceae bacterium]MCC6432892.1 DNA-3-methyladenine glycosylase 2 family protein [Gemmatimonadaceae bacterium]
MAVTRRLTSRTIATAVDALRVADPKMARAIDAVGPCTMLPRTDGTHFDHLARAIVYQQLSGSAAATIYGRFTTRCGDGQAPSADAILQQDDATLRACGLSTAKTAAIKDLARHVVDGRLPLEAVESMDDEAIIEALVQVRGVGRWTAQMFLMFRLGRPDVLPVLDLGVRKGAQRIYNMRALPEADRLEKVARNWRPWASIASWYCWRVLDLENAGGW